ncbi:ester cyclase [Rhodococcus sp. NCIMB 12038]|uniref:ester cyclase n=1 Tax=Rhodococcus sp. NCIMB 12038 TaxID=933800 RepID=UPI0015C675BE|nr:ester cyclase [Rhodococcus sp. NCIMB 12038]
MSTDAQMRNSANFERFQQEVIVSGDFTVFDELVAPGAVTLRSANSTMQRLVLADFVADQTPLSREGFERAWSQVMSSRANHRRTIETICASGDTVAARWSIEWIQQGQYLGRACRQTLVRTEEVGFVRFDNDGRIIECWFMSDPIELWMQLGIDVNLSAYVQEQQRPTPEFGGSSNGR